MLILFVLVPLLGGVALATREIADAREQQQQAEDIQALVSELIETTELRAAIVEERNLASALTVVNDLGLDPALIGAFAGIDIVADLSAARAEVDRLIPSSVFADQADRLGSIRATNASGGAVTIDTLTEAGQTYTVFEADLGDAVDARIDELFTAAGRVPSTERLISALRAFAASSDARASLSRMSTWVLSAFFGVGGPNGEPATELLLIDDEAAMDSLELIRRVAVSGSLAAEEVERFIELSATESFLDIARSIAGSGAEFETIEISEIAGRLDDLVAVFVDGDEMVDASFELVAASGSDVLDASNELEQRARNDMVRVVIVIVSAAVVALAAVTILVRLIARPTARLAEGAQRIRDGEIDERIDADGPREIRGAALALNELTAGLEHFRDQTDALARGETDLAAADGEMPAGALGESVRGAVDTLASSIAARDELSERLAHEAAHDSLTRVSNRRASLDALRRVLATEHRVGHVALLFVDLDGFKQVNDQLGHRAGDVALREVAHRLGTALGDDVHVGRLGGDEFVVIVDAVPSVDTAIDHARHLIAAVSAPIGVDGLTVSLSASIGIALGGDSTSSALSMLHEADVAVYEAKRAGSGSVRVCDEAMRETIRINARLEAEIRTAIDENQFEVWLQPVVEAGGRRETAREALIRWRHPDRGIVMPDDFIDFAERSDLIVDIDRWVIDEVARLLAIDPVGTPIAINVSGRHLGTETFVDDVVEPLQRRGIDPSRVVIEVTESAVLDDVGRAATSLEQLRSLGVRVAIDDFGTGYASLSYLRQLPIDVIKIDRSFTRDDESRSLVSMVVETGRLLDLRVVAEGVEDESQARVLEDLGVDRLQGYHFGRPLPFVGEEIHQDETSPVPGSDTHVSLG